MSGRSRRDFLKIAVAGAAGAALPSGAGRAADKSVTLLHESSFIKVFDEYMQKTLAPAYEKETGVKIVYELTSVGSLPTRMTTITETGSGADVTMSFLLLPFLFADKLLDVTDIAEEIGKKAGRLVRRRPRGRNRQRQMEGDPVQQYRPADELAHRLVRRNRGQEVSRDLGGVLRGRQEAEGQGPPVRTGTRPRFRRQPRVALPAVVVIWRGRGSARWQDRIDRFG